MQKRSLLSVCLLFAVLGASSQFVTKPLNYQVPGNFYLVKFLSVTDEDHAWVGTFHYDSTGQFDWYNYAVHTSDGGDTWQFDSIPAPGNASVSNVAAVDANICYYTFTNNWADGSIWKTTDAGATWTQKNTTQFQGGFLDFYHPFDENEGVAVGDPNGGFFEVQKTADGGDTWNRVPSAAIPAPLTGEMGLTDAFSAVGDDIWFATSKGRCYHSPDKGATWSVSLVNAVSYAENDVAFSSQQKGVFFDYGHPGTSYFYKTADGGSTWSIDSVPGNHLIGHFSPVEGFDGGFAVSVYDPVTALTDVLFTPDFFQNTVVVDSNLMAWASCLEFKDASTGWLSGAGYDTNDIMKYAGVLTSIGQIAGHPDKVTVIPNPTVTTALLKLPATLLGKDVTVVIYDLAGRQVGSQSLPCTTGWASLNATRYPGGNYIVAVILEDKTVAQTIWNVAR